MGYYSDVALVVCKESAVILKERLASADEDVRSLFTYADNHTVADNGDELFRWQMVKWYDNFPEVEFVHDFIHDIEPDNYLFIRVGETYTDIEMEGDYWKNAFGLDVSVSIITRE